MPTVSAFWGPREATRDEAARLVALCLSRLAGVDDLLTGWRNKSRNAQAAARQQQWTAEPASLAKHLRTQRTDFGHEPMPELGFSADAWNGAAEESAASFSLTVGATNAHVGNACVVCLPQLWLGDSLRIETVALVLREVWSPDKVVVFREAGDDTERLLWAAARGWRGRLRRR